MEKIYKLLFVLFFTLLICSASSYAQGIMQVGEELSYEVSYIGIKLGTIKIVTENNQTVNNIPTYKTKAFIKSYSGIPFVSINVIYESWIDKSLTFAHKFVGHTEEKGDWVYQEINFDYVKNNLLEQRYKYNKKILTKSFIIDKKWNDGLSLFFLARKFSQMTRNLKIPTYVDDTLYTSLYFGGKRENVEISSSSYPIKTIYFNGNAGFKGVYGLSGYFEGWFSDDADKVPIKAKVKVIVGNVDLELIQWKRKDWQPPRASE